MKLLFSILSLRGVKRRSNPVTISKTLFSGLLRYARNDGIFLFRICITMSLFFFSPWVFAHGDENVLFNKIIIDRLEVSDQQAQAWEAQAWLGNDAQKFWFKSEGERVDQQIKNSEFQFLYDKPIADFWDLQLGWRRDVKPDNQDWFVLAVQGLAPYWVESNLALFIGDSHRVSLRAKGEYEFFITQQWVFIPEAEVNMGNEESNTRVDLRMHYSVNKQLMPYVGIQWQKNWKPDEAIERSVVLGLRTWF